MPPDPSVDEANAAFWNELCGTTLAKGIGATGRTPEDLGRFDRAYLDVYPYLDAYLPMDELVDARVLEIGLGYGTLGNQFMEAGARYTGVDISPGPVAMMQYRIGLADRSDTCAVLEASALALPFEESDFDFVYSIGCLHHTGDLPRAVSEVRRVLRPGGRAVVMVYSRWSARRVVTAPRRALRRLFHHRRDAQATGGNLYDLDQEGNAPPHTHFVSVRDARRVFREFSSMRVDRRNIDIVRFPPGRRWLLAMRVDRIVGLDLYVQAVK